MFVAANEVVEIQDSSEFTFPCRERRARTSRTTDDYCHPPLVGAQANRRGTWVTSGLRSRRAARITTSDK